MGAMVDGTLLHMDVHQSDIHEEPRNPQYAVGRNKTAEIG
jgi:hypothetical protein